MIPSSALSTSAETPEMYSINSLIARVRLEYPDFAIASNHFQCAAARVGFGAPMWQYVGMSASPEEFRSALSRFASGVTVVTGRRADGSPFGITVSAFTSVSLEPPLILVCIQKTAKSCEALSESAHFCVNVLSDSQTEVSNLFASRDGHDFNKVEFSDGSKGVPVIAGTLASIECSKAREYDGGDHTIFVGQVEKVSVSDGNPLVYWGSSYRRLEEN